MIVEVGVSISSVLERRLIVRCQAQGTSGKTTSRCFLYRHHQWRLTHLHLAPPTKLQTPKQLSSAPASASLPPTCPVSPSLTSLTLIWTLSEVGF